MLSREELWKRIKVLEGKIIYSITNQRKNTIRRVTEKEVFTDERQTPVRFYRKWGIYKAYEILHKEGYLITGRNSSGAYLTPAIILAAVPDEAVQIDYGIKLIDDESSKTPVEIKCKCGCYQAVSTGSEYIPGHDAKHRSALIERAGGVDNLVITFDLIDSYIAGEINESDLTKGIRRIRAEIKHLVP